MQAALKEKQVQRKAAGEAQAAGGAPRSAARQEIEALYTQHNPVRTTRVSRFTQKVLRDTELRVLTGGTRLPPGETC